ncbi:MAG TPA: MFS transporter [Porphyromonadaceae bacterium]|nr:MFS transporter [Porphyromonadaceae bacterium]
MNQTKHPKGLYLLFMTEMAERFSCYGMRALFVLYLISAFFNNENASQIYGSYTGLVYLTPLLGGYISDRYWGNRHSIIVGGILMAIGQFLMFASACFVQQSIFSGCGEIVSSVDNHFSMILMFIGLVAIIFGNGFFKPNISTMVGDLYPPTDRLKDSAFTIFYMGINIGAFIAPLICGPLGNGDWTNPSGFKWGFFSAGCAMVVSLLIFIIFKNKYLVTPEGIAIGLKPLKNESTTEAKENREDICSQNSPLRIWGSIVFCIALFFFFSHGTDNINDYISSAVYAISIVLPIFIITDKELTKTEKKHIGVIYIIAIFVIFFWSAYEQAGSSLTIFADQQCDRHIGSWEMPTTWFQSINPILIVVFAPLVAMLWEALMKKGIFVSSPMKQAIGILLLSLGYFVMAYGSYGISSGKKMAMIWLFVLYFFQTMGELALSPIGLSLVNKLSPAKLASLLMGVWFMSNATSNILAGNLATLLPDKCTAPKIFLGMEISTLSDFFLLFAVSSGVMALILFLLCPLLNKMMKGIE